MKINTQLKAVPTITLSLTISKSLLVEKISFSSIHFWMIKNYFPNLKN